MAFARPDLKGLIDQSRNDIDGRLPGADSRLRRSALDVLARVVGGALYGLYGYLDYIANQILVDTADTDHLDRHAAIWGILRKAAQPATGPAAAVGSDGVVIPAGTVVQRLDGFGYVTTADATIAGGGASLTVAASTPGLAGQTLAGSKLTIVQPIAGVSSQVVVSDPGLNGGADEESDDELRARVLLRIQSPPHGGAEADYEEWALAVPGVTRVWVYPAWMGLGTVGLTFMMDDRADPAPLAADVDAVAAYLETVRPVTAEMVVFAPIADPVNLVIQISPASDAVKLAVEAELVDFFRREATPGGILFKSRLDEAISLSAGEHDHVLISPAANIVAAPGHLPTLGTVTWQG